MLLNQQQERLRKIREKIVYHSPESPMFVYINIYVLYRPMMDMQEIATAVDTRK